jgi:hypothetical protein
MANRTISYTALLERLGFAALTTLTDKGFSEFRSGTIFVNPEVRIQLKALSLVDLSKQFNRPMRVMEIDNETKTAILSGNMEC